MSMGLLRGAWLSAVIGVFFIAIWAGKKRYWLLVPAALVLVLAIPVARERVVPSENVAVTGEASLISYTTGRWVLWTRLWDEIESGLPMGHGSGYAFTLSSEDLFGAGSSSFAVRDRNITFVYTHNDFLFWMVDLGLIGLLGMAIFWVQIVGAFRAVSRSGTELAYHVHVLSGVLITTLITQAVANILASLAFAARFFIVAGFVFGARQWIKRGHALGTEPAVAVPEAWTTQAEPRLTQDS
jgi:O-antigen ligase